MTPFNQKYPPQMVAEIAYGMEEPVDIAFRYGISASEYRKLAQNAHFQAEVAAKTAELMRAGHTVKVKAQFMAEDLLETLYLQAKDPKATFNMVHEAVKTMAKLADLEPKANQPQVQGGGTAIHIIFNNETNKERLVIGEINATNGEITNGCLHAQLPQETDVVGYIHDPQPDE